MLNIGALCNFLQKTNQSWPEQRKRKRSQELRTNKNFTFLVGLMILTFIYFCLYTKHITPDDLWVIIGEEVYDLSDFADEHPVRV